MSQPNVEKIKKLIKVGEAFVKEVKALLGGWECNEVVLTQQDWDNAEVVNHAESLIEDVEATIAVMREEIEN
jgi:hypothetical protein